LKGARTELQNVKPDSAVTQAQSVIDLINGSSDQGMMRGGIVAGALGVLLVLIALIVLLLRRRKPALAPMATGAPFYAYPPAGYDTNTGAPLWPPAPPAGEWQSVPPEVAAWQATPPPPPSGEWPSAPPPAPPADPETEAAENPDPPAG